MSIWKYLLEHTQPSTAKRYISCIQIYLDTLGERKARNATYQDIMEYLGELRKQEYASETVRCHLAAIKKYYQYLVEKGREDNPARNILIKDKKKDIQLQDLFTTEELELLLERKERYVVLEIRNKVVISLLIYQALSVSSIASLTIKDVKLDKAELYIKSSGKSSNRTLPLKTIQINLFHKYISEIRTKLLGRRKEEAFIITKVGTPICRDDLHYLVSTFQYLFPDRKLNPRTIRQSVIHNHLKAGKDLRVVQVFSGHKNPSSTEVYKQKGIEELQNEINKFHPLG